MMKRLLLCTIVLMALLPFRVAATQYLVLTAQDGTVSKFALTDMPVITFSEGQLVVTCGTETLTTSMEGLKTSFEEVTTGIRQAELDNKAVRPVIAFGEAAFEGLKAGDAVTVYSLDGKTLGSTKADGEGRACINLNGMGHGVLILRTPTHSFKIKH